MFKNIYYNHRTNKYHLWEVFNGKQNVVNEEFDNKYYTTCAPHEATHKDIYGTDMIAVVGTTPQQLKIIKEARIKTAEADIDPEIRILQERYQDVDDEVDMSYINTCFVDLEIATGHTGFEPSHLIKIRKKD